MGREYLGITFVQSLVIIDGLWGLVSGLVSAIVPSEWQIEYRPRRGAYPYHAIRFKSGIICIRQQSRTHRACIQSQNCRFGDGFG